MTTRDLFEPLSAGKKGARKRRAKQRAEDKRIFENTAIDNLLAHFYPIALALMLSGCTILRDAPRVRALEGKLAACESACAVDRATCAEYAQEVRRTRFALAGSEIHAAICRVKDDLLTECLARLKNKP